VRATRGSRVYFTAVLPISRAQWDIDICRGRPARSGCREYPFCPTRAERRNLVLCRRLFLHGSLSNELDGKACETKATSHAGRKRSIRSWGGPGPFGPAKLELAAGAAGGICIPSNTDSLSRAILG